MAVWQEMVDVLREQLALYEAMLELANKKSELIVDGKVRELEKLVLTEENLLAQGGAVGGAPAELAGRSHGETPDPGRSINLALSHTSCS